MLPEELPLGFLIDKRYEITKKLGEGASGSVYLVRQTDFDNRELVIKFLSDEVEDDEESQKRFLREARILAKINNKNIVTLHHASLFKGHLYVAMEYMPGENLKALLNREERLPARRALGITIQLCEALKAIHDLSIVHRDLKPQNVLIGANDEVKLIDFGLARSNNPQITTETLTMPGLLIGSPEYMSPEQCRGEDVDSRSDIYSLGCLLYQMLTGETPFQCDTAVGLLYMHSNEAVSPLSTHLSPDKIPAGMQSTMDKALAKKLEERYQSVSEFMEDLRGILAGTRVDHPLSSSPAKAKTSKNKYLIGGLVATAVVGGFAFMLIQPSTTKIESFPERKTASSSRSNTHRNTISATPEPAPEPDPSGQPVSSPASNTDSSSDSSPSSNSTDDDGMKDYWAGRKLMDKGLYKQAIKKFDAQIAIDNLSLKKNHGKVEESFNFYRSYSYQNRAFCLLMLGKTADAIPDLSEAISLRPKYQENYLNRAKAYAMLGKFDLAEVDRKKAAQLKPGNTDF